MTEGSPFGLSPKDDYPRLEQADGNPAFGENHAFWLLAEDGSVYINAHLNSVDSFWPLRRETLTICLPAGRALVEVNEGWGTSPDTIASGGMRARCIEPMRRWRLEYKGTMRETTQAHLARNVLPDGGGRRILVDWEADIESSAPLFRQGGTAQSWQALQESSALGLLGGARYEQLVRAKVRVRIHGEEEHTFDATGSRTHRAGVRRITQMLRSDWQSALFPDGSGFYLMRMRRDDNGVEWEEACILQQGHIHPATILTDHWITDRSVSGERIAIRLQSDLGIAEIEGTITHAIFRGLSIAGGDPALRTRSPFDRSLGFADSAYRTIVIQQACAHYAMNAQAAYGICERHNYADQFDSRVNTLE